MPLNRSSQKTIHYELGLMVYADERHYIVGEQTRHYLSHRLFNARTA